ncbi:restriction endonuclease subunit S [Salmonella enterica]
MSGGKLPEGWVTTHLSEICSKPQYGYTTKSSSMGDVKFLRTTDITKGAVDWSSVPYCMDAPEDVSKYQLQDRDIVISRAGSVGFSFLVQNPPSQVVFASYLIRFKPVNYFSEYYLKRFLESSDYWNQLSLMSAGNAVQNVNAQKLSTLTVPIPPIAEQKIIAEKLDTLLAQVDSTKARLEQIPQILKRFRQSILTCAIDGTLTSKWRETVSPAKVDIVSVSDEMYQNGITYGNFGKKTERANFISLDELSTVIKHVENWPLIRIGSLCDCIVPNRDKPKTFSGGFHWLLTQNFDDKSIWIDYSKISLGLSKDEVKKYNARIVNKGSVIMTCIGRLGLSAVLEEDSVINQQLHAFIPNKYIKAEYLAYCIRANQNYFKKKSTSTTIDYLNKTACNSLPIPLPSLEEQHEIVRRVEQLFAWADTIEKQVNSALTRVNNLTQSILAKAFRGELTAQWRAENPDLISGENSAAALLEKIKAERAASSGKKTSRKKA